MLRPEWRLPGPYRFAETLAADLGDGRSAIALLPSVGFPAGIQAAVRERLPEIEVNRLRIDELAESRGRVVDSLYDQLRLDRAGSGDRVDAGALVRHAELGRRLIWVDCRGAQPSQIELWITFLEQYAAVAAEVPLHHRTVFATLCDGRDSGALSDSLPLLAKRWWWGVVSPLDTRVLVAEALRGRSWRPAFAETVAEVAGFDLALVELLVEEWDGSLSRLRPLLSDYPVYASAAGREWSPRPSARPRPPLDSLAAWGLGVVNAWEDQGPHPHACFTCATKPSELKRLIWLGQVRGLMPRIELERQALAEWVRERRNLLRPRWDGRDIRSLEVNELRWIFEETPFRNDKKRSPLARWLHEARNRIAHLDTLEVAKLEEGRSLLLTAAEPQR